MTDDQTRQVSLAPAEPPNGTTEGAGPNGAAPALPMTQPVLAGGGASRMRWAIALGVAGLAVVSVIAAVLVFGSRPTPPALGYVPGDAVVVVEFRPELPGDQLQKVGNLLSHFPGFADQSTLPTKLDEALARLVESGSDGSLDYATDLKPWLSGPAFAGIRIPPTTDASDPRSNVHGVVSLTTTGTVSCAAVFEGRTPTQESYQGLTLSVADGSACVLDGNQALLGDVQSVRDAIDAHRNGTGIDKDAGYARARASLEGDRLATLYVDGAAYSAMFEEVAAMSPGTSEMLSAFGVPLQFPEWIAQGLRAEDDALVVDAVVGPPQPAAPGASAGPSLLPMPAGHESAILPLAPAGTIAFVETQGAGVALQNLLTTLSANPMLAPALEMLDGAGDPAELVGWAQDAGVLIVNAQGGVTGGVAVVAESAAAAEERVSTLTGLIALAGMGGADVESSETTINGVTVTTVTIRDLRSLVPAGQLPEDIELPEGMAVELSIAAKDRVILVGAGESFMRAVLDIPAGGGLADQAGYRTATAHALPNSQASVYVAVRDIIALVEPMIPAESQGEWTTEIKPYIAPFQAFSISGSTDGSSTSRSRVVLSITNP